MVIALFVLDFSWFPRAVAVERTLGLTDALFLTQNVSKMKRILSGVGHSLDSRLLVLETRNGGDRDVVREQYAKEFVDEVIIQKEEAAKLVDKIWTAVKPLMALNELYGSGRRERTNIVNLILGE